MTTEVATDFATMVAQAEADRAHERMLASLDAVVAKTMERINKIPQIEDVYKAAGIGPSLQNTPSPLQAFDVFDVSTINTDDGKRIDLEGARGFREAVASYSIHSRRSLYTLARTFAGDGAALKRLGGGNVTRAWDSVQDEIGTVGTRVIDGRISVEPNPRMRPTLARGRNSNPGEYQELKRVDVQTYRQVNEVSSLICNALIDPVIPQAKPGLAEVVKRADMMIQNAMSEQWRSDASSFTYVGFSASELQWAVRKDGFTGLHAAKFRDQSTVDQWHFDDRGGELVGAKFEGWSNNRFASYVLPRGLTPESARLLIVNIGAVGNDIEGVPPTRPCISLEKLRQLIIQSYGISYQRFGVPLMKVSISLVEELSKVLPMFGGAPSKDDIQKFVNQIDNARAHQPGSLRAPPGIEVDYLQPLRDMPSPMEMLRYIDEMKAVAWTNEASTLGRSNYGSYAMADASDAKYMRSAPAFMRPFLRAYDHLMRLHVLWNFPDAEELDLFPTYSFRFAGTQNSSKWLQDARDTLAAEPWNWPEAARRMAAQSLMLPPESFDSKPAAMTAIGDRARELEPGKPSSQPAPQGDDIQSQALNGAQVTSMVEVLAQVAAGLLPAASAILILQRAFQMTKEEATAMVSPADGFDQPADAEPTQPPVTMANDDPSHVRAARRRIQTLIETGELEPATERKCVDCAADAMQYDHTAGYESPETVEPVCASCHTVRTNKRGGNG